MTTFDIALKYLEGLDLTAIDLYSEKQELPLNTEDAAFMEKLIIQTRAFIQDPENNKSNLHYRGVVFATAIMHLAFKQKKLVSAFDVACEIVEYNKELVSIACEKYLQTVYPKFMMREWFIYCNGKPELSILSEKSEIRNHFFHTAYHYIIEPENA